MVDAILDDRYRVLAKLGEGGMGDVYLVEHVQLGRKEALKVLKSAWATEAQFVQRFRREARATNRLQHRGIVGVHDFGRLPDGRFYLSMEYIEGEVLSRLLHREQRLDPARVVHLMAQLADAVDHAHERGVVHRDLKPANLMLATTREGGETLKVLDFGIAKIVAPDYNESRALTAQGEVFGTIYYMAPEQVSGAAADARTDLYAIGCIAFECLVGETPFVGRRMQVLDAHLRQAPEAPSRRAPEAHVPPALDAAVLRCLEKDPARRFQRGADLAAALRASAPVAAPPSAKKFVAPERLITHADEANPLARTQPDVRDEATTSRHDVQRLRSRHAILLRLADALLDLGVADSRMIVAAAQLTQHVEQLHRYDRELAALRDHDGLLEQAARERQRALRFAAGELRFDRGRARADVETAIAELEAGLAAATTELARDHEAISDQMIALVAHRATLEELRDAVAATLEGAIAETLPRLDPTSVGSDVVDELRRLWQERDRA